MTRQTLLCMALVLTAGLGKPRLGAATLDECFQDALKQSETLAENKESIFQAREQYHQAIAAVLPNVSLNYSYLRQDDHAYSAVLNEFNPASQSQWTVTVAQPLFRGFAEYAALREVKDSLVSTQDAARWAAMQIYQDVAQAFFMVLSLEHSRSLINDELRQYDGRIKEEKDFCAIGRSKNSDLETVEADKALLQSSGVQVDEQIVVEREVLAFLTGKDPAMPLEATDPAPIGAGDLDALLKGIDRRPDIHAALMQEKAAQELVKINKGAHLPSVDFLGHWYPAPRPGIESNITWDAGISASLPLFQGFALMSKDRQAESMRRQSQLNVALLRRQAASSIRQAWSTLTGDLSQIRSYDLAYGLSTKAYRDLEKDYRHGLDTNQDVLIAMTASWVAKQSLDAQRFSACNDFEQLQTIAGRRLDLYPVPELH